MALGLSTPAQGARLRIPGVYVGVTFSYRLTPLENPQGKKQGTALKWLLDSWVGGAEVCR